MAHIAKLRMLFASAFGPAIAVLLLALFIGYAILGPNGLLAWGDYKRQLRDSRAELKVVQAHRARIANRVDLLNPRHVDPDMADEMIRRELNVGHPDEIVVPLK
ncbi:MAG: septum formation initiator family protein [Sphingomonadales bacterium]|nr:MAG: septum formation initiator family protein [Sphingomonadales bacterium]TNF04882.1 MAG: septum formation initiator family protein [Sphingomonadales bacterium]